MIETRYLEKYVANADFFFLDCSCYIKKVTSFKLVNHFKFLHNLFDLH